MNAHVFVDESKAQGYLVAAVAVHPAELSAARQIFNGLILPGQRRIHFHKEKNSRRQEILSAIIRLRAQAVIYRADSYRSQKAAREACLAELIASLSKINARRLILERDDSTFRADQQQLYREVRETGIADTLRYDHMRAHEECLLAMPDAIAWCWARGGRWRSEAQRVVTEIRQV